MAKPIGNQTINLKQEEKVGLKTKARFGSRPAFFLQKSDVKAEPGARKAPKYKTRKK